MKPNGIYKLCIFVFAVMFVLGCQKWTDYTDQRQLRKQSAIPDKAELIEWDGFPYMNGFGQREGLSLKAKYKMIPPETPGFEWNPLPVPDKLKKKIPFRQTKDLINKENGYYRCMIAGDDVLNAEKLKSCKEVSRLIDIVFTVWDDKGSIYAVIVSGY